MEGVGRRVLPPEIANQRGKAILGSGNLRAKDELPGCSRSGSGPDEGAVRKSIYVLAGLGLAGAIALSAMLRQALEARQTAPPTPYVAAIEQALRGRLQAPPRVRVRAGAEGRELSAALVATAGQRAANVAAVAGAALWQAADAARATVVLVAVEVAVDGGETLRCEVPRGAVVLPRKSAAAPPSAPQPR